MRRVLVIVQNLPVPFDRRVWQISQELVRNGYAVSVICPKAPGYQASRETIEGVDVYRHPLPLEANGWKGYAVEYGLSLFWEFTLACKVFCTRGFDVVHACNPPDTIFFVGSLFKVLFGRKFVFDHHDLCPELYEAKFAKQGMAYRVLRLLERLTFLTADVSIATNNSYRRIAVQRGRMPPDRVFVVRSGPKLDRLRITEPDERLKMGRRFLIGYVGVMGRQEGLHFLISAMRHIVHDHGRRDVHCTLVGSGPELGALKQLTASEGVEDFITFAGRVPDEELLAVLNTADVCVNPDTVNPMNDKSTMNKVLEYMALGKPIVQFDMTEGRFSAGESSLYAIPNDAADLGEKILELLGSAERRAKMGAIGRARIEQDLAWQYGVPSLLAAYDKAFESPRRRRWAPWSASPGRGS